MKIARALVAVALLGQVGCGAPEEPDEVSADAELNGSGSLLALGDSIAYGWRPEWEQVQGQAPSDPGRLKLAKLGQGYPEKAAKLLGLTTANGSCPGEASGSFLDPTAEDNGCREKRADGLKMTTPWQNAETQLAFAKNYIASKKPSVITLTLGGNDIFLLRNSCSGSFAGESLCIATSAALGSGTTSYQKNLDAVLQGLFDAGHRGTVVLVTTYAMYYTTTSGEPLVFGAFNRALTNAVASAMTKTPGMKVVVADAYTRFQAASEASGWDACKAGLLIDTKEGKPILDAAGKPTCDRHPSEKGHALIAEEIAKVSK
jgi:lysophospholipase L1-like esterase